MARRSSNAEIISLNEKSFHTILLDFACNCDDALCVVVLGIKSGTRYEMFA